MNIFQAEIDRLKSGIAEALPGVIVRGSLIDHESLRRDELQNGVITVLLERIENDGDWRSKLRLLITGQLEVPGRPGDVEEQAALGAVIEKAEIALYARLRAYLRNTGGLPHIEAREVQFSAQSKPPFGWFLLRADYGPLNEACLDWDFGGGAVPEAMYPPQVEQAISTLSGVDVKIDIEPHESAVEHHKWADGDESTSQPDVKTNVELK